MERECRGLDGARARGDLGDGGHMRSRLHLDVDWEGGSNTQRSHKQPSLSSGGTAAGNTCPDAGGAGRHAWQDCLFLASTGMAEVSMQVTSVRGDPTAKLTDDILANIITRVPYKSTCCCKCVSTRWRDLISDPYHRNKMAQPLIGFFYESCYDYFKLNSSFINISGKVNPLVDTSLSFLPRFEELTIMDCCNGLLLCSSSKKNDPEKLDYVVCNPATEKWVVVPGSDWSSVADVRLAFDPTVSSHFHVCEFVDDQYWVNEDHDPKYCIAAVVIYSSKTGVWSHKDDAWKGYDIETPPRSKSVLFRGVLYLCALDHKLVALDVEENNWKVIPLPTPECHVNPSYDIYLSQGQLYFAYKGDSELSIWVLEDPSSENWTLKHNVSHLQMFGTDYSTYAAGYSVLSVHPDRSLIFLVCWYEETLMSYDMDSRELCILCQHGRDGKIYWNRTNYLRYVPSYSVLLADGH